MVKAIGIDSNWKEDAIFGFFLGLGFIILNTLNPSFAIGYPIVAALTAQLVVIIIVAPVVEEILFRSTLISYAQFGTQTSHLIFAVALSAVLFSVFHFAAYGIGLQTAFIGAGLFGAIAGFVAISRQSVLPVIIMHAMLNGWLYSKASLAIGV